MRELVYRFQDRQWICGQRPRVMGILNVTPDSFSDGGEFGLVDRAVARGVEMVRQGADVVDIGGESTRPGAAAVSASEEAARVVPVIKALSALVSVPLSIDTVKADVAVQALAAGASIINDISGFRRDPGMWAVLRRTGAGGIAMHMRGTPVDMQSYTSYTDLVGEIRTAFADILSRAAAEGVHPECLMLDPGIGFSKTAEQNLVLIRDLGRFRELERPVLLGPSRKSFIGKVVDEPDPRRRVFGTAAAVALGVAAGADVVRVHDVLEMRQAALVAAGIRDGALPPA